MGEVCSTHGRDEKRTQNFGRKTSRVRFAAGAGIFFFGWCLLSRGYQGIKLPGREAHHVPPFHYLIRLQDTILSYARPLSRQRTS
jgi:hypothetical protein